MRVGDFPALTARGCAAWEAGAHLEHLQTAPQRLLLAAAPTKRLARRHKLLYAEYSSRQAPLPIRLRPA
ncbi:hypothetical protein BOSE62_150210 [Bosea sp. 62]|nr:hypothetical protein BOSE21B_10852 [Bosea sp. 21B]CAD5262906.1 hypothetical protein BOSE7B_150284 [Bosea sp. 7B]CAD5271749.1 hypothetical protein BOSE46_20089 [Bosea sp. 46]VVT43825.1 hypothetical protein BOS5A_10219 [Bosea sp. EC-HK365B]VXB73428.1 hypothetical protein BOSE62_150210 [Bosea sp. 62]VXC36748.1 hypothetical protein BOSE127_180285 [Bosea sp. 127]VXC54615.1 hypothetical protein BOSE125_30089 [Bosea sp. 125]